MSRVCFWRFATRPATRLRQPFKPKLPTEATATIVTADPLPAGTTIQLDEEPCWFVTFESIRGPGGWETPIAACGPARWWHRIRLLPASADWWIGFHYRKTAEAAKDAEWLEQIGVAS